MNPQQAWDKLIHLKPEVQGGILIVLGLLTWLTTWLLPDFRHWLRSVIGWPFRFLGQMIQPATTVEGSAVGGIRPNIEFDVSCHPSGRRRRRGVAFYDPERKMYHVPVYARVKGRDKRAYLVQVRFPSMVCTPLMFSSEGGTAQLYEQGIIREGRNTVVRILQLSPRFDGKPELLGYVLAMPHLDKDQKEMASKWTLPYNVMVGSFAYPRTYLDQCSVELLHKVERQE
ncbi:MAG: hypothetical protein KGN02_14060 [bacterium]|nr:hypothetical protein [bacterium]